MAMSKKEFIQAFVIQQAGVLTGDVTARAEAAWDAIEGQFRPAGPSFDVTQVEKAEWEADSLGDHESAAKMRLGTVELSIDSYSKGSWRAGLYTSDDTELILEKPLPLAKTADQAKEHAIVWCKMLLDEWSAKLP